MKISTFEALRDRAVRLSEAALSHYAWEKPLEDSAHAQALHEWRFRHAANESLLTRWCYETARTPHLRRAWRQVWRALRRIIAAAETALAQQEEAALATLDPMPEDGVPGSRDACYLCGCVNTWTSAHGYVCPDGCGVRA